MASQRSSVLSSLVLLLVLLSVQVRAFYLTIVDKNLVRIITRQPSSNALELYTELSGSTFENTETIRQLAATLIPLGGDLEEVSFRWLSSPVDGGELYYTLKKYQGWRRQDWQESNQEKTIDPVFSIPPSGTVPTDYSDKASEFRIHLDCSGLEGRQQATIQLFIFSSSQAKEPIRYTIYTTIETVCPPIDGWEEATQPPLCEGKSAKSTCKTLCNARSREELAALYCNASAIVVGTFRKTKVLEKRCENRVLLADWRSKQVSSANSFAAGQAMTRRKFQVVVGSEFRTCKCLRRLKRDKRYIFLGEMSKKSRTMHLTGAMAFVAKRSGDAREVLGSVRCP
ncbi:uncharacterized protein LOC135830730 [Sycon ciliatum]|uniref:uncharacterized protein LOC135830730 n=1 Tax=Sycon ciliatum TaxID=27933 RepID=UPI0020AAFD24|eukprot:scpid49555/ scgid14616/ 